jgi:pilus assembly protein CpaF
VSDALNPLGPLAPLLADDAVTEVVVNGAGDVWVERRGRLRRAGLVLDVDERLALLERLVAPLGRRLDRLSPLVDARLPDGCRLAAVIPPVSVDGPCLAVRRRASATPPLEAFAPPDVVELLVDAVRRRCNVVVSGATSSGKTTLLDALAAWCDPSERVVTLEDVAELRVPLPHVVRLECRPATVDGLGAVDLRALVRAALRLRPDRLVVGEVRGAEAFDMLQALSTGHDGSLTTCHANSALDALGRLEVLALLSDADLPHRAVREQVHAAVDVVVHVARRPDGARAVVEVVEPVPPPVPAEGRRVVALAVAGGVVGSLTRGRHTP